MSLPQLNRAARGARWELTKDTKLPDIDLRSHVSLLIYDLWSRVEERTWVGNKTGIVAAISWHHILKRKTERKLSRTRYLG